MFPPPSPPIAVTRRERERDREPKGGREEEEYGQVRRRFGIEEEVRGRGRIARRRHGSDRTAVGQKFANKFSLNTLYADWLSTDVDFWTSNV